VQDSGYKSNIFTQYSTLLQLVCQDRRKIIFKIPTPFVNAQLVIY